MIQNSDLLGASSITEAVTFTGYLNLIFSYNIPMAPVEILSTYSRTPVNEMAYESYLAYGLVVQSSNSVEFFNKLYFFGFKIFPIEYNTTSTQPQAGDLPSDKISVCEFYSVHVSF
jgi:hypothetical protein